MRALLAALVLVVHGDDHDQNCLPRSSILDFDLRHTGHTISRSNLGGYGGGGGPQALRFSRVASRRRPGAEVEEFDLRISNITSYTANNPSINGLTTTEFGVINLASPLRRVRAASRNQPADGGGAGGGGTATPTGEARTSTRTRSSRASRRSKDMSV